MERPHDTIAGLIPEYVLGSLSSEDRETVEGHLSACLDCQGLLETARELRATLPAGEAALTDHPDARILYDFTIRRDRMTSELTGWVENHVASCDLCREATELVRPAGRLPEPPTEGETGTPWWRLFSRTLLHPAAAAAYLLLLVLLVPFAMRDEGTVVDRPIAVPAPMSILGPAARLFGEDVVRGDAAIPDAEPQTIVVEPGAAWVRLDLIADLDPLDRELGARLLLRIDGQGGPLESVLAPTDVTAAGSISVLLPAARLSAGETYQLSIVTDPGEAPLFRCRFMIRSPG